MVKNLAISCGFISSIFILLHTLLYIFRDYYYLSNNNKLKKIINKFLPFLTKYNYIFIVLTFLFAIFHILLIFNLYGFIINSGYVILFVLFFIIKFKFFGSKKLDPNFGFNILAYFLFASLAVHIIFKV